MAKSRSSNLLLLGIVAGIIVGVLLGGFWPGGGLAVKFLGELFLRALKMVVVPLVMTSMIVGVSRLGDVRRLGRIGGMTVGYYLATTAISVFIGLVLVNVIKPGQAGSEEERIALRGGQVLSAAAYSIDDRKITLDDAGFTHTYDGRYMVVLLDQEGVRSVVAKSEEPPSRTLIVSGWTNPDGEATAPRSEGVGVKVDLTIAEKVKGREGSIGSVLRKVIVGLLPNNIFKAMVETDVLPIIVFSLLFGAILTTVGERGRGVLNVFEGLNDAIMKLVHLIMITAPVGTGALVAGRLADAGGFSGFWKELVMVGKYSTTVIVGLLIHGAIVLPLVVWFFGKQRPLRYAKNLATALATAFSTASSSATLPVTMECTTKKCSISERTASFVLPLGATVNMDGTALYEAVAAIFIAQIYGIELGFAQMVIIFLTATLAAIGAAGIPQAGLVTMVIVLRAVDLPIEGISLILIVDWFLDRCRTTVNVWGDAVGAAVIERLDPEAAAKPSATGETAASG